MFGYVRPMKPELLVKEYDQYKAVYCELCKELGESFGIAARNILSYDCTFYAMLALALSESKTVGSQMRCRVNPLKKCGYISSDGDEYKKAAAFSVIVTYYKLCDNIDDDGFFKATGSRILRFLMKNKYKKAGRLYPWMEQAVAQMMEEQAAAETDEQVTLDKSCEPMAKLMQTMLTELAGEDEGQKIALSEFGYFFGRWIYTIDAADDLAEDLENGNFNPFIKMLSLEEYAAKKGQKQNKKPFEGQERKAAEEACNQVLNRNIARMIPAFNLIELDRFESILRNIIEKGLPGMQQERLFLHTKEIRDDRSV